MELNLVGLPPHEQLKRVLKACGYGWVRVTSEKDQERWVLIDPEGNETTVQQAVTDILANLNTK